MPPARPLFKSHNPGCNCCPDEKEPDQFCGYIGYPVSPFYFVNQMRWSEAEAAWSVRFSAFSENTTKYSSFWFPMDLNISPSISDTLVWVQSHPLIIEGSSEAYGGNRINGGSFNDVIGDDTAIVSAPISETCPFGSGFFGNTLYPSFRDSQRTDSYNPLFGTCFPPWVSGTAPRARAAGILWLVCRSRDCINNLEEQPTSSMLLNWRRDVPPSGGQIPSLFDPAIFWPFEPCTGTLITDQPQYQ